MNIVVTGNRGFIGSHVIWELSFQGHGMKGYDQAGYYDREDGEGLFQHVDIVIHCAANLIEDFDENIAHTFRLINSLKEKPVHFIFLSSAAVYGDTFGAKEDDKLQPFGAYGLSKSIEERMILEAFPKVTILRLANVYGYNSNHGVIDRFMENRNATLNYPGHSRDFVHVDDVVGAITMAVNAPEKWQGIFNISTNKSTTMEELWNKLRPGEAPNARTEVDDTPEIVKSVLNNEKARALGWEPKHIL